MLKLLPLAMLPWCYSVHGMMSAILWAIALFDRIHLKLKLRKCREMKFTGLCLLRDSFKCSSRQYLGSIAVVAESVSLIFDNLEMFILCATLLYMFMVFIYMYYYCVYTRSSEVLILLWLPKWWDQIHFYSCCCYRPLLLYCSVSSGIVSFTFENGCIRETVNNTIFRFLFLVSFVWWYEMF